MAKDPEKPPSKEKEKHGKGREIDPRAHRRLLRFINAAQKPEDLAVKSSTYPPDSEIAAPAVFTR